METSWLSGAAIVAGVLIGACWQLYSIASGRVFMAKYPKDHVECGTCGNPRRIGLRCAPCTKAQDKAFEDWKQRIDAEDAARALAAPTPEQEEVKRGRRIRLDE
jgi:hypothetical protein